jgi:GxxExxY protein
MIKHLHAELTHAVIAAAFEVHKLLGAGFSEDVYRAALAHELKLRQIPFEKQVNLPVIYKTSRPGITWRIS